MTVTNPELESAYFLSLQEFDGISVWFPCIYCS